jgi:3-dehydrosphinganine reductase
LGYFSGKKVIVTGGSAGIGRAAALRLARDGAHVCVLARGQGRLDETVAELRAAVPDPARRFTSLSVDVSDRAAVRAGVERAVAELGGCDVLICNSGSAVTGLVEDLPDEAFDQMMALNYMGHVNVVRALIPHFIAQKSGDISLVTSMLGFMGLYGYSAYAASKFAIVGFGQALRQELSLHNVRVTVVYPPTTDTPGLKHENESKPPVVWALEAGSGWNKTYSADEVAQVLLQSVERGRFDNIVGWDSWLIWTMNRHLPGITRSIADSELKGAVAKVAKEGPPKKP